MTRKYVSDLTLSDVIIDRHTGREIVIEYFEPIEELDKIMVFAHYDDNGDPWDRPLSPDSEIKVR
jgi:hypothetical protein